MIIQSARQLFWTEDFKLPLPVHWFDDILNAGSYHASSTNIWKNLGSAGSSFDAQRNRDSASTTNLWVENAAVFTSSTNLYQPFFVGDGSDAAFIYMVTTLCHEMIHQYDLHFGSYKRTWLFEKAIRRKVDFHTTPTFEAKMKEAEKLGIKITTTLNGIDLRTLSEEAINKFIEMNESEDDKQQWLEEYQSGKRIEIGNSVLRKGHPTSIVDI